MFKYVYLKHKVTIQKIDVEYNPSKHQISRSGETEQRNLNPTGIREGTKDKKIRNIRAANRELILS